MEFKRFGIIGVGAMGSAIASAFDACEIDGELTAVYDMDSGACRKLISNLDKDPLIAADLGQLVDACDFVIEAASQKAVKDYVPYILSKGKGVLVMSAGALLDPDIREKAFGWSKKTGAPIHIPSGAVAGIDGLLSAVRGDIEELTLTTTKPPMSLHGVQYLKDKGLDMTAMDKAITVFEGPASEAAKHFPKNINVAAVVSFAADKEAFVRIIASPFTQNNQHEIVAKGAFGKMKCQTTNVPAPSNPKTSYLAILSAIATLQKLTSNFKIGN